MKEIVFARFMVVLMFLLTSINPALQVLKADLPPTGNNKVAYFVFDSGGPDRFPLTTFTGEANIVVLFEGTLWELADSAHYYTGWMTTTNVNYRYYSEIIRDVRILQARGVKVLMNVDDAPSWSTSTPFTTYDGIKYNYQQFAEFIKHCAIDVLHLDGIALDIEHKATGNAEYIALIKEIGKYFGPLSSKRDSQIYTAAIYSGGAPGYVIGKSTDVAAYFNFVMDMGYFQHYIPRFNQWADHIGASKTMVGVLNDFFDLDYALAAAAWQPAIPPKAGIMVYAANNLKSYTDAVFNALVLITEIPEEFALKQNYPNPFNAKTTINYELSENGYVTLKVYDAIGREIRTLVSKDQPAGRYTVNFDGAQLSSGIFFYSLTADGNTAVKKMVLMR